MIRSYLEPRIGTLERAREFERMLLSLDAGDLHAVTPLLGPAHPAHPLVWGTDDVLFDVSWAYWLRDTIPGTAGVVTVDGARRLFPEERLMDLVHLEQHSAAVTPGPGVTNRELRAAEATSFDM